MTMRVATTSWRAREALANREPFNTYGALRAVEGAYTLPWGTRLPDEWRARYESEADDITYTVISYDTPIAWVLSNGQVIAPPVKYSITTSRHQGMLYALERAGDAALADAAVRERQAERDRRARNSEMRGQGYRRVGVDAYERPVPVRVIEPDPEPVDILDRIDAAMDPRRDPEFPYDRRADRLEVAEDARNDAAWARSYNDGMASIYDRFDPEVVQYRTPTGELPPLEERPVPRHSGEGAIYTPEYLKRAEGNRRGVRKQLAA